MVIVKICINFYINSAICCTKKQNAVKMSIFLAMEFLTLLEQKVAGTKSREVAQCFEKFSELKVAGTKSRGN